MTWRTVRRLIGRGLLALAMLLIAAAGGAWLYLDRVVASVVARGVAYAGGAPCKVSDVSVSPWRGQVSVGAMFIANPPGYPEGNLLTVASARTKLALPTLWRRPVHIRELEIRSPVVRLMPGEGGSNVAVFLDNVRTRLPGDSLRMVIDRLIIKDAQVRFEAGTLLRPHGGIRLADLELTDIRGQDQRGVSAGQLAGIIVLELVQKSAAEGRLAPQALLPEELTAGLSILLRSSDPVSRGQLLAVPIKTLINSVSRPAEPRP